MPEKMSVDYTLPLLISGHNAKISLISLNSRRYAVDIQELVGSNIKQLRLQHKFTLKQLAGLANLTGGYISLLERGLTSASLDTLEQIANCLDADISALFIEDTASRTPIIIRSYDYLFRKLDAQRFETSLTHFEHSNIIPSIQTVLPFGGVLPDILCHDGEMFIYVIDGILTLDIGGDRQDLYPADSAHFMSSKCYRYWNETRYTTKIFVAKLMADASRGGSSTLSVSEVIR